MGSWEYLKRIRRVGECGFCSRLYSKLIAPQHALMAHTAECIASSMTQAVE